MNATGLAMAYVRWLWDVSAPKVVIELDEYRRQKWLRHYTRPIGGEAA